MQLRYQYVSEIRVIDDHRAPIVPGIMVEDRMGYLFGQNTDDPVTGYLQLCRGLGTIIAVFSAAWPD